MLDQTAMDAFTTCYQTAAEAAALAARESLLVRLATAMPLG